MTATIFITGVSSGLGEATARLFAARGWRVIGTVRRPADATAYVDTPNVTIVTLDVTDAAAVERVVRQAFESHGRIDVLVNNAGYFQMGPLETSTMAQIRAQYETNVFGLIAVTKAFLPRLRAQGAGTIVNVASTSAENGYPFGSVYSSTKGAVAQLTEALNVELAPIGVTAKAVFPGLHATRIFMKVDMAASVPDGYRPLLAQFVRQQKAVLGTAPARVAEVIWSAVHDGEADRVRYYSGPDAVVIPRAKRLLGSAGYWRFFRRTLLEGAGWLTRRLAPQGTVPVEFGENVRALQTLTP